MKKRQQIRPIIFLALCGLVLCVGCYNIGLTYFDPTTYQYLTELKPRIIILYDSFTQEHIDSLEVKAIQLKFAQILEYEKGKGETNSETIRQIEIIQEMFEDHVDGRLAEGPWSDTVLANYKENIRDAFDKAIQTEWSKNPNR